MPLSDLMIKNLKPALKAKKYADGEGLFLFISITGSKSWRFRYRNINGKEQLMTFGLYPAISLQEARAKRFEMRKIIQEGKDPLYEQKEAERRAKYNANNTFMSVAKEWHDLNKDKWTRRHNMKVWNRLEKYAFPAIGNKPIKDIHGLDVIDEIIRPIEKDGKTETSHAVMRNCSAVFRYAFLTRRIPFNPLADLRGILKPHRVRSHPTIEINQLPEFLKKLENFSAPEIQKLALKFLLLTFVRQGELRRAKWEYFDFKRKLWVIPAHLMKMRRDHLVPLSKQAIKILKEIKAISGNNEYVFPPVNLSKYPYMNENAINRIIKEMEYKDRLVGHGFRSLASTTLNELGYSPDIIEKQLAHEESNNVRKAYNRAEYLPQRFEMMQGWADHIDLVISKKDE